MSDNPYLKAYREEFVKMITTNSKEEYSNHSRLHANIIIQELVRHARKFAYIQCSDFAQDIYGDPETQAIIKNAIAQNVDVRIAVRNAIQSAEFASALNEMREGTVRAFTSVSELDFCVTDPYRYRKEVDKVKGEAKVCANGPTIANELVECFRAAELAHA